MNRNIVIALIVSVLLIAGLLFLSYERVESFYIAPTESYYYESDEAFGTSILHSVLKEAYGEEQVVSLSDIGGLSLSSKDSAKAYMIIGNYISYDSNELDSLSAFIAAGNDALIITGEAENPLDSILLRKFLWPEAHSDSIINLSIPRLDKSYELVSHYEYLDSIEYRSYSVIDTTLEDPADYKIHSTLQNGDINAITFYHGEGSIYLHSIPYAFTNISLKQEDMKDYVREVLPLLDVDTLYLDHTYFMDYEDNRDQNILQYIMSQPGLKAAYYLTLLGLLLFLISRAKRRQKVVPVVIPEENTSLEYVQTVSQLYRSHNQHHKLVKHIETIFNQWVSKKYYIKRDHPRYIEVLSQKSKIEQEQIEKLIKQMTSAKGNNRFDEERLTKLYKDLHHFYKNCK